MERVDENAFGRLHMGQVITKNSSGKQEYLYFQAKVKQPSPAAAARMACSYQGQVFFGLVEHRVRVGVLQDHQR